MKISYHCLGCGKQDQANIDLFEVIKSRKDDDTLLNLIAQYVKINIHTTCGEATLGVRTSPTK